MVIARVIDQVAAYANSGMDPTVTLTQLARMCGVSTATVSKVLSPNAGRYRISAKTRAAIMAAIATLGAEPQAQRRLARRRQVREIGVICGRTGPVTWSIYPVIIESLSKILWERGWHMSMLTAPGGVESLRDAIAHHHVDGVVVCDPPPLGMAAMCANLSLPAVAINSVDLTVIPRIIPDDRANGALAVRHLRQSGHRRIGFHWFAEHAGHHSAVRRLEGIQTAAAQAGVTLVTLKKSADHAVAAVRQQQLTAIIAYSDLEVLSLIGAARRANLEVPHEVSLISFNNLSYLTLCEPPITVIDVDGAALAAKAVDILFEAIEGKRPASIEHLVPGRLIRRASVIRLA